MILKYVEEIYYLFMKQKGKKYTLSGLQIRPKIDHLFIQL